MEDNREKIHQIISQTVERCLPKYNSGLVLPVCDLFLELEELGEFSLISNLKESLIPFGFNPNSPNYGWCRQPDKQGLIRYLCELQSTYGKEPIRVIQPKFPNSRFLFQNLSKIPKKVVETKQIRSILEDFPDGVILPNEILLHILRFSDSVTIFPLVHWDFLTEGLLSHLVSDEEMWSQALKAYNPYFSDSIMIPNGVFKGKIKKVEKSAFARFCFVYLVRSSIQSPWVKEDSGIFSFLKFVQAPITCHPILLGEVAVMRGKYRNNKFGNSSFLGEIVSSNFDIDVHAQVCKSPARVLSLTFEVHSKRDRINPYISIRRTRGSSGSFEIFFPRILHLGTSEDRLIREMFSLDISVDTYIFRNRLLEEFRNNYSYYEKVLLRRFSS
ncbi:hypothetical protein pv_297 [Pithovirus sibericum]|uniref:Uncharacterized protein n=1 Tax=Pithovirus sibericum TaxID=1450746 RepID=W5S5B9_9VIRU|nr:hypothetical protein pv_297 [Pithovirus sibericum]AHH01864.1 hypothetical protein pv_297 [Pithovirus sibericum]